MTKDIHYPRILASPYVDNFSGVRILSEFCAKCVLNVRI
jgi:hypothetical protein